MSFIDWAANKIVGTKPTDTTLHTVSYIQELRAGNKVVIDSAEPLGVKTTPALPRVNKAYLEVAYHSEPNMFNSINKTCQMIMAAGYRLIGDEKSVSFFHEFFDSIGSRGGEMEWEELITSVFKHQLVYGEAWNELIPAKRDKERIVDLQLIDPKKMDYGKNSNDRIALDKFGDPVGYVETLPLEYTAEERRFAPPKDVSLQSNQIFFPPDKLAHYKLYTIGDGFYGVGLIEPSYKTIVRKMSMEEALANAVHRTGFPRMVVKLGDATHQPTDEQIQRAIEKLKKMDYLGVIGHPDWIDVKLLQADRPERLQEHLKYYIDQMVTGTGLPNALATGMGDTTNRATLNQQVSLAKLTLKDIIRRTIRVVDKKIIQPVAASNNVNPVKILWGEISIEELDGKARRLAAYTKAGLLSPDKEIEDLIRKFEDLPERGKDAAQSPRGKAIKPDSRQKR